MVFENTGRGRVIKDTEKYKELPKPLIKIIKDKKNVLDVGCGTGWLRKYVKKENYYGISYSEYEIKNLKKVGYKGMMMDLTKKKLPFKSNSFDCIFASHVIEHFEKKDLIALIYELRRILKDKGIIILVTPTEYSFGFYGEWTHVRPYNHTSLPGVLNDFDFRDVKWLYPKLYWTGDIFQRYGRFILFPLRPILWKEVYAWGYK